MKLPFLLIILISSLVSLTAQALRVVEQQVILDKLDDYNMCQGRDYSGEFCHDALVRWVEKHPADAFTAGKMTRLKMNAWAAIPFFAQAFNDGKGNCKDTDVKLAVVSGLNLPITNNKAVVDDAKKIGFEKCFSEIKEAIIEAATVDSYAFKNTCKELIEQKSLTGAKAKKCSELK